MPMDATPTDDLEAQKLARARVSVGPVPDWAQTFSLDLAFKSQGAEHVSDLLLSEQVHAELHQNHCHFAYRLETTQAVQKYSQRSIAFEPRTQKIVLHFVRLRRGDAEINQLDLATMRIIQREEGLERYNIHGRFTILLVLEDVRPGDVLEWSYTTENDPDFLRENCLNFFSLPASVSISRFHFSVRFAGSRALKWESSAEDLQPVEEADGELKVWKWERSAYQAAKAEPYTPSWHLAFPWIHVSDCADWKSVAAAFAADYLEDNSALLDELVGEIRSASDDPLQQVSRAIDFVQTDCRYLGTDLGKSGYVPARPGVVARRRYGDCKDLSLLLVCLLKSLNVPAVPMLVHAWSRKAVADMLPDPALFNHVVVEFTLQGQKYWVDPTIGTQGGGALNRYIPDFGVGLPVAAGTSGLADQPRPRPELSRHDLRESILLDTTGQFSYFGVNVKASGEAADSLRNQLATMGEEAFAKERLKICANRFGQATRVGTVQCRDDRETNEFLLAEVFEINGFLQRAQSGFCAFRNIAAGFSGNYLPVPGPEPRKTPFALAFPFNFSYLIEVESPRLPMLKITPRERIQSPHFSFIRVSRSSQGYWKTNFELTTLADSVPADQVAEHRKLATRLWQETVGTLSLPVGCSRGRLPASFGKLPPLPDNPAGTPAQKPALRPTLTADPAPPVAPMPKALPATTATRIGGVTEAPETAVTDAPEALVRRPFHRPEADEEAPRRRRRHRGRFFWVTPLACGLAAVIVLACMYVLLSSPAAGRKRGIPESDVEVAKRYRQAAVKGDAKAQNSLGMVLMTGHGDGPDPVEAALWFRKAADQGLPDAEFSLGVSYYEGRGLAKDTTEAVKWYRRAAEHGVAKAQHNLSLLYMNGLGVERDEAEAIKWCRLAAEQGLDRAQADLGIALIKGKGTAIDDVAAVKWLRKAADQGYAPAQYNLGMSYGQGRGVPKDPVEGYAWIKLASRLESKALPVLGNLEREFPPAIISAGAKRAADLQQQLDSRKRTGP